MWQTLSGWVGNAMSEVRLLWAEPLTWLILTGACGFAVWRWIHGSRWRVTSAAVYAGVVGWLLVTLAITVYPIDVSFEPAPWERFEAESVVPLVGTVRSFGNMRDRTMTADEHAALTAKIADDLGIPSDDVNLSWRVRGTSPAGVLRDPIGNLLLFVPLGLLGALHGRHVSWRETALIAAAISTTIEASQLVFGLGSLASVDDVIFNTAGALAGFAVYRTVERRLRRDERDLDQAIRAVEASSP